MDKGGPRRQRNPKSKWTDELERKWIKRYLDCGRKPSKMWDDKEFSKPFIDAGVTEIAFKNSYRQPTKLKGKLILEIDRRARNAAHERLLQLSEQGEDLKIALEASRDVIKISDKHLGSHGDEMEVAIFGDNDNEDDTKKITFIV